MCLRKVAAVVAAVLVAPVAKIKSTMKMLWHNRFVLSFHIFYA
jgi:hypothetical protein